MPPFGFGMSMPNLRQVSAAAPAPPPAPVTLVQENWVGSGLVAGRTPSPTNSGGGTWQIVTAQALISYAFSRASVQLVGGEPLSGEEGVFRHSVALTNATISTTPSIDADAPVDVYIWARSNPGPDAEITSGYYARCENNNIRLFKRVSGSDTELGSSATPSDNVPTSLTVSGSTITVKMSGTAVITVTDSSITSSGYFGCRVAVTYGADSWVPNGVGAVTIQTA